MVGFLLVCVPRSANLQLGLSIALSARTHRYSAEIVGEPSRGMACRTRFEALRLGLQELL